MTDSPAERIVQLELDVTAVRMLLTETTAERDRLRAELDAEIKLHEITRGVAREIAVERDRLRAVVDALRMYVDMSEGTAPTWIRHRQTWPGTWQRVLDALARSDGPND